MGKALYPMCANKCLLIEISKHSAFAPKRLGGGSGGRATEAPWQGSFDLPLHREVQANPELNRLAEAMVNYYLGPKCSCKDGFGVKIYVA